MDFRYTSEEEEFRGKLHSWLEKTRVQVFGRGGEPGGSTASLLDVGDDSRWQRLLEYHRLLYDAGYVALHWPTEYGGGGATLMEQAIYQDEVLRFGLPLYGANQLAIDRIGPTLMFMGTKEQKERYLHRMLTGEEIWCQGYSEPNAGSDLAGLQTTAVLDGDHWVINGSKIWTSSGHWADHMFFLARTDKSAKKQEGITFFVLDDIRKTPGFSVRPILNIANHEEFAQEYFENVRVPKENVVGEVNKGWTVAKSLLGFERL